MQIETTLELNRIYNLIKQERDELANIHTAYKDFPSGIEAHFNFYDVIMLKDNSPLPRGEKEFLAVLTSKENDCPYCIEHHQQALKNNQQEIRKERKTFYTKLVKTLCHNPWQASVLKNEALQASLSNEEYSHAVMIISYFNMANRMAFAQGIEIETDFQDSCK